MRQIGGVLIPIGLLFALVGLGAIVIEGMTGLQSGPEEYIAAGGGTIVCLLGILLARFGKS